MQNRNQTVGSWLLIAALAGGAFITGSRLRSWQIASIPHEDLTTRTYALLKLTPECAPVTPSVPVDNGTDENRDLVSKVFKLLKIHYVEPITPERETAMARGAVKNMLDSLADPDSRFLDPKERQLLDDASAGRFKGIGAVFAIKNEKSGELESTKLVVITPMPGSPAETAGLKSGDSITHIDGKWIITHDPFKEPEMNKMLKAARNKEIDEFSYQKAYEAALKKLKDGQPIADALDTLASKDSGDVTLQIDRPGVPKPIDLKIDCKTTTVTSLVSQDLTGGIEYIRIAQFSKDVPSKFSAEIERAKKMGFKGIILDLRGNPGGLFDSVTNVVGKITGGGVMGTVKTKAGQRVIKLQKTNALKLPVIVLVNNGTASVAELAAGTLHDSGLATLVGNKTFGDGLLQTPLILKDGSEAVITTGKMLTAKGTDFEGKGIKPDREIKQSNPKIDTQLEEAVRELHVKLGKA